MAIISTDILIKTAFEAALNDLRKNSWILDDIFGALATDQVSSLEYGHKEVAAAKQWFLKNKIDVLLGFRNDEPTFPSISIVQMSVQEKMDRTSLGDDGQDDEMEPIDAHRPIQKIIPDFTPQSYSNGIVTLPKEHTTDFMAEGQYLVTKAGKIYQITELIGQQDFRIEGFNGLSLTSCYVAPANSIWNVRREVTFLEEMYSIGLHTQSEPSTNGWLRQIVVYILLRYKEVLFEARGFENHTFQIAPMQLNPSFPQERIYSTFITLNGTVEANWIKYVAPKIEKVQTRMKIGQVVSSTADLKKIMTPEQYRKIVASQSWEMADDHFADFEDNDEEGMDTAGLT